MSYLLKPTVRRRHSSLFQRMESQINKISKQLNATHCSRTKNKSNFTRQKNEFENNTILIDRNYLSVRKDNKQNQNYILTDHKQNQNVNSIKYLAPDNIIDKSRCLKLNNLNQTLTRRKRKHSVLNNFPIQSIERQQLQENTGKFTDKIVVPNYQYQQENDYNERKNKKYKDKYIFYPKTSKLISQQQSQIFKFIKENNELSKYLGKLQQIHEQSDYKYHFLRNIIGKKAESVQAEKNLALNENIYAKKLIEHYKMKVDKYKQMLVEINGNLQYSQAQLSDQEKNNRISLKKQKNIGQSSGKQYTKKGSFKLELQSSSSRRN